MKKYIKFLFTLLICTGIFTSCEKDGGESVIDLKVGAVPDFEKSGVETLLLSDLADGEDVQIEFSFDIAQGDVKSADIIGFYNKNGEVFGPVTVKSGITTFPEDVTLNTSEILNAFPSITEGLDTNPVGGEIIFSAVLTLQDGTVLKLYNDDGTRNYGSDIHTSTVFNPTANYPIECFVTLADASKFNGSYTVAEDEWADYAPGDVLSVNFVSDYTFRISNADNPYVVNAASTYLEVTFDPSDGSATVTTNETWDYGVPVEVSGDGSVSTCSGAIELSLDFSPYAEDQTLVLLKN